MGQNSKSLESFLQGKNLNHITSLNLSNKDLEAVPSIVFKCKNLVKLNISHNRLSNVPKEIVSLRKLKVLNLSHNRLTQIPAPVCRLPQLKTLDLSYNLLKTLPKQLVSSQIINLIVSNNKLEVIDFSLLVNLERLVVSNNGILSFNPVSPFLYLKYLWVNNNPCTSNGVLTTDLFMFPAIRKTYPKICESIKEVNIIKGDKSLITKNNMNKNKIFISYAHADEKWLDALKIHLKGLQHIVGGFDFWDDKRLRTGDKWNEEIEKALQSAGAAILIISPSFLASDFITNDELPPILEKARKEGTHVFPVIARKSLFTRSKLANFQSVNPPERPLNACSEAEIDDYLCSLMDDIAIKMRL